MNAGDVPCPEMCANFGVNLQRGMNFRLRPAASGQAAAGFQRKHNAGGGARRSDQFDPISLSFRNHSQNSNGVPALCRIHSACERACCTISTKTFRVSAGLLTSLKNAMRAPRMPFGVFNRT